MPTLTPEDLDAIKRLVRIEIDQALDTKLDTRLRFLPTREEFLSRMDELLGIIRNIRDELVTLAHRVRGHEDRVTALEDIHPGGQHPTS